MIYTALPSFNGKVSVRYINPLVRYVAYIMSFLSPPIIILRVLYREKVVTSTYGLCIRCPSVMCQKAHQRKAELDKQSTENARELPGINACVDKH